MSERCRESETERAVRERVLPDNLGRRKNMNSGRLSRWRDTLFKIDEIAAYNGVKVRNTLQNGGAPELSILRHARRGYNLIALRLSGRAADHLSYGSIADTLLETADRSFIFLKTE